MFHYYRYMHLEMGLNRPDFSLSSFREVCIHVRGTSFLSLKSLVHVEHWCNPNVDISIGFFEHFGTIILIICILLIIF
jgi:hypothetical protein